MKRLCLALLLLFPWMGLQAQYKTFNSEGGQGSGTQNDPYLISSLDDWKLLSACMEADGYDEENGFYGKYIKLTADVVIPQGEMLGWRTAFRGTFDGNGHAITFNRGLKLKAWDEVVEYTAPFRKVGDGAVIKNLRVKGLLESYQKYTAGLVGLVTEDSKVTIIDCWVSMQIQESGPREADATNGGIVARTSSGSKTSIINCLFDGQFGGGQYSDYSGGLVGYKNGTLNLTDCLFDPSVVEVTTSHCKTLARYNSTGNLNIDNCYYTQTMGDAQGTDASAMSVSELVAALGPAWLAYGSKVAPAFGLTFFKGAGTEADPYLISSTENWNYLAAQVNRGTTYQGTYFKLVRDISVTTMVGSSSDKSFRGKFDGGGRTLTLDYTTSETYCAPFRYVRDASISNLQVAGTIRTSAKCAGGIAGYIRGNSNIKSCRSTVTIQATKDGDGSHGGFIGEVESSGGTNIYFTDCLFDGRFNGPNTDRWGGFVGWKEQDADVYFNNCLFDPSEISIYDHDSDEGTGIFCRYGANGSFWDVINPPRDWENIHFENTYFTKKPVYTWGILQGLDGGSKSYEELVSLLGSAWELVENKARPQFVLAYPPALFAGSGTAGEPYLISTQEDWDNLALEVAGGESYSGKYFKLTNNIPVTRMVGSHSGDGAGEQKPFSGTFDGGGRSLTLNLTGSGTHIAPFSCLSGATIRNLRIEGSVSTTQQRPAGVAGYVLSNTVIENCENLATLSSSYSADIDAGAYVARVNSGQSLTITGCTFLGSIEYNDRAAGKVEHSEGDFGYAGGGFVGYAQSSANVILTNCFFHPKRIIYDNSAKSEADQKQYMFVGGKADANRTFTNCYYSKGLDTPAGTVAYANLVKQGKSVRSVSGGDLITVAMDGVEQVYDVSGITAYKSGDSFLPGYLYHGGTYSGIYGGIVEGESTGDALHLLLSFEGTSLASYVADKGTLSGTESPTGTNDAYTLTLANAHTVITARGMLVLSESTDNTDIIAEIAGSDEKVRTVTLLRNFKGGKWNSFCVPFAVPEAMMKSVFGADAKIKRLTHSSFSDGALTLTFESVSSVEAGKPYLLLPAANVERPVFESVTLVAGTVPTATEVTTFTPVFAPLNFTARDKTVLLFTADGKVSFPSDGSTMPGYRAYLQLTGLFAGDLNKPDPFVIDGDPLNP